MLHTEAHVQKEVTSTIPTYMHTLNFFFVRMLIPLDEKEESYYELFAESDWDLEKMKAPNLFAFVCKQPLLIPMDAKVSKIMTNDNTSTHLSDGKNFFLFLTPSLQSIGVLSSQTVQNFSNYIGYVGCPFLV